MPIYGFHCGSCNAEFETLVRASDTVTCPSCGGTELERLLSRIAKPASGGEGAGAADAPSCGSASCCFGGGCG